MATWQEFTASAPDLARAVEERFRAHTHHVMATLRADGSPRLCGTEVRIRDGEFLLAGMPGARRFADLRRDRRIAVHTSSDDAATWVGDARLSGVARELASPEDKARFRAGEGDQAPDGDVELFAIDVTEAVHVGLDDARTVLVVRSWTPSGGLKESRRE